MSSLSRGIFLELSNVVKGFKRVLLTELVEPASNLEGMPISEVTPKILLGATDVVEEAEKMGIIIEWFDRVIRRNPEGERTLEVCEESDYIEQCI